MENKNVSYNINMSRQELYNEAKRLSLEIGENQNNLRARWRTSNKEYWNEQVIRLRRNIRNRLNNYNRAIQISNEIDEPLQRPLLLTGSSNEEWVREVRRLRMRARRNPARIARINIQRTAPNIRPILQAIPQALQNMREQKIQKEKIKMDRTLNKLIEENKFQEVLNLVIDKNVKLTEEQANRFYNNLYNDGRYILHIKTKAINETTITINQKTMNFLISILMDGALIETYISGSNVSDAIYNIDIREITNLRLEKLTKPTKIYNRDGKFFNYINTTNLDLKKYQIFTQDDVDYKNVSNNLENCLIHTLKEYNIDDAILNSIKLTFISGSSIRRKDIPIISNLINKNITIHQLDNKRVRKTTFKCKTSEDNIDIALYENHYFKLEQTNYSTFYIKNYDELKNIKSPEDIINKEIIKGKTYYKRDSKNKINSLMLVDKLFNNNYFKKLDLSKFSEAQQLEQHIYLDNIEMEQKLVIEEEEDDIEDIKNNNELNLTNIWYADCETFVDNESHELQLIGAVNNNNNNVLIFDVCGNKYNSTKETVDDFLDNLIKYGKSICYFHNLKYDYNILEKYMSIIKKCEKDNQIYNVVVLHKNVKIEFRDSYKLIPFSLSKFQTEFNLPKEICKKEAIAYEYYTKENHNKRINIDNYYKLLSIKEQKIFKEQIKNETSYNEEDNTFNPLEYYKEYLRLDCLVLKNGLIKFRELIKQITEDKMDILECLTISSLTDKYMIKKGAYNDVYKITGNLREYVSRAVMGGRVAVNEKYKKKVIEKKIADYDGVSLYPSAINRLCREMGLPTGIACRYKKEELNEWKNKHYSIMTIKILKVNKHQQMPIIAHKSSTKIDYKNDIPESEIIIDNITLEDYIKFHKIEYEIIDGIYWNGEGNKTMGRIVNELFNERIKQKKANPALANVIKLMLNSSYGKTIMKKTTTKNIILNYTKEKLDNYTYNNFNTIKEFRTLSINGNKSNVEFKQICVDTSYNRGHIGCAILSMSKRIMNEVFDIANTNNLPIYYTDTDSIHCNYDDVKMLEDKYKIEYKKELNGINLEQFHTDFQMKGAVNEIYAKKSIFLGKKSYMDLLESKDKDGKIINDYHIRLKGITKEGLEHIAKKYENSYLGLYEDLSKGKEISIILNPYDDINNSKKVLFEFKKGIVKTRKEFIRKVKF